MDCKHLLISYIHVNNFINYLFRIWIRSADFPKLESKQTSKKSLKTTKEALDFVFINDCVCLVGGRVG